MYYMYIHAYMRTNTHTAFSLSLSARTLFDRNSFLCA